MKAPLPTEEDLLEDQICRAIWEGNEALLWEIAGCRCCCDEHTFGAACPAYRWGGCRGQGSADWPAEEASWERHYATAHGLTRAQFYGDNY